MACPDCASTATTRRKGRTALGSRRFCCRACRRRCNERTGPPFTDRQDPTDLVRLAVLWRLRSTLGFRDVAERLLQRGFEVTHETIRAWEVRFAPRLADQRRAKRRGQAGGSWYLDETSVQGAGHWCSLDRALDREGVLRDSMRSAHRDKHAARRFLRRPGGRGLAQAAARHHGPASAVPQSDPLDPGEKGAAPMQPVLEHPRRAKPPGHQAAVDEYPRECLAIVVAHRLRADDVLACLTQLFAARWRSLIAERQAASWAPRGERLARFVPAPCDLTEPSQNSRARRRRCRAKMAA